MTTGYVLFRLTDRTFATPLDEVREIVRLQGVQPLPGARPPLSGVVVLRGAPLPVLDVRPAADRDSGRGDVLVLDVAPGDTVGVAVDQVLAVLPTEDLPAGEEPGRSLPPYVVGVRRSGSEPVLLVDLHRLLDVVAAGWESLLPPAEDARPA